MAAESAAPRSPLPLLAAQLAGLAAAPLLPFIIGALVTQRGYAEHEAGLLASLQLGAGALASIVLASRAPRIDARRLQFVAVLAMLANVAAAFVSSAALFALSRFIAGASEGVLLASASAAAARTERPERTYAFFGLTIGLYAAAALAIAGQAPREQLATFLFLGLAAIDVVALLALSRFPTSPLKAATQSARASGAGLAVLAAIACCSLGMGGLYGFVERIGAALDVSAASIGQLLAAGAALAIAAPLAVVWLGVRAGRFRPLIIAILILLSAALMLAFSGSRGAFAFAVVVLNPINVILTPYFLGLLAWLDPQGRLAAAGPAALTIGTAIGPAVVGAAVSSFGAPAAGACAALAFAAGLALLAPVGLRPAAQGIMNRG